LRARGAVDDDADGREVLIRPPELAEAHIATIDADANASDARLPRPQRVAQRIDAEVGGGGFGAKGG
jgi:hypothetical protein